MQSDRNSVCKVKARECKRGKKKAKIEGVSKLSYSKKITKP